MLSPARWIASKKNFHTLFLAEKRRRLTVESLEARLALSASSAGLCSDVGETPTTQEGSAISDSRFSSSMLALNHESSTQALSSTNVVRDWVGWYDRYDVYELQVTEASRISIELSQLSGNLKLSLHDSARNPIASSNRPWNLTESLAGRIAPGRYFVKVQPNQSYDVSRYELTVSLESIQPQIPSESTPPNDGASRPADPSPSNPSDEVFPDVAYFGGEREWSLNSINAPEAWAQGYDGSDVVVAVLDTGMDLDHADLNANLWRNGSEVAGNGIDDDRNGYIDDLVGWDFWADDNLPNDTNGHGTHVAGIIASARNGFGSTGVAHGAQIMPVQVLGPDGSGSMYDVAAGIRYAVDNGADIINMSLGSSAASQTVRSAIQYAEQNDVLIVAAAGNRGTTAPEYPARFGASFSNVLSVGAYGRSNSLAGFSNRVGASGVSQVDAPGVGIYSSYGGNRTATLSGTSMAAPHVAGLAALALSANPLLSALQLTHLIIHGADQDVGRSDSAGGINAARTVAQAIGFNESSPARSANAASSRGVLLGRYYTQHDDVISVDAAFIDQVPENTTSRPLRRQTAISEEPAVSARSTEHDATPIDSLFAADDSEIRKRQLTPHNSLEAADEVFSHLDFFQPLG